MDRSMCVKVKNSQGCAIEASETLNSFFSQQSDTAMVSSSAEYATNDKSEITTEHQTPYDHLNRVNYNNMCVGVNPPPVIEITSATANDNESRNNNADVIIESIPSKEKKKKRKFNSPLIKPAKVLLHPKRFRQHFRRRQLSSSGKEASKDELYSNEIDKVSCCTSVNWCYLPTLQVNCSGNNDDDHNNKLPMTAEEKLIIEQLLAGCSPTVQSIVNVGNRFTIPPPFDDEESGEKGSSGKARDLDKLMDEIKCSIGIATTLNESSQPKLISLTQQLSPIISDIEQKNNLTASQQIPVTPFDTKEDEDASNQPLPYDTSKVNFCHIVNTYILVDRSIYRLTVVREVTTTTGK